MKITDLKPCPFCGGSNICPSSWDIQCYDCKATLPGEFHLAAPVWNRRAALALQTQQGVEVKRYRHKKRGSEYDLLGIGKMQAENWFEDDAGWEPVDMREVAIYRSLDDGSLWVRPREEFEDGRFEPLRSALVDVPAVESEPVAWKQIEGYEGLYEVSSGGDVRSTSTGKILAKNLAGSGYVKADLWKDGERHQTTVHRLVADAFIPRTGDEINHINGVKTDNRRENLEWCSRSENVIHTYYELGKGIHPIEAYNPDTNVKRLYRSVCEAARDGFGSAQIYRALRKPHRRVKGFHFSTYAHPPRSLSNEGSEIPADLLARCKEVVEWKKTGRLPGSHLRDLGNSIADRLGGSLFIDNGLNQAELQTIDEALTLIITLSTRKGSSEGDGSATITKGHADE